MISHPLHGQTALPFSIDRLPTLILAECVLVYLDPDHSANIIDYFGKRLQNAAFLVYEQVCVFVLSIKGVCRLSRFLDSTRRCVWETDVEESRSILLSIIRMSTADVQRRKVEGLSIKRTEIDAFPCSARAEV